MNSNSNLARVYNLFVALAGLFKKKKSEEVSVPIQVIRYEKIKPLLQDIVARLELKPYVEMDLPLQTVEEFPRRVILDGKTSGARFSGKIEGESVTRYWFRSGQNHGFHTDICNVPGVSVLDRTRALLRGEEFCDKSSIHNQLN